jgi:SAM-dependent methyltransferase
VHEDVYDTAYRWGWNTPHLKELVRLCYKTPDLEENARRFLESAEFQVARAILADLGSPPSGKARVLDFGCGNGVASYALSRSGYPVTGVDSSGGDLAGLGAAEKIRFLDGASFDVKLSSGPSLPFDDRTFGIVWMREVLHHIGDLGVFLSEVSRVLSPGGLLCCMRDVVIWNEEQRAHFFANHPFYPITHDEGCYYLEEYMAAFRAAGFEIAKILDPVSSVINTYPEPFRAGAVFDEAASRERKEGYDLYSFFLRKPKGPVPS